MSAAACANHDPTWWDVDHPELWPQAIRVCLACPVRPRCAGYAATIPHVSGVWAGVPLRDREPAKPRPQRPHSRSSTVVEDFHDTWDSHHGDARLAAQRLGMTWAALSIALRRARAAGADISFHNTPNGTSRRTA